MATLGQLEEQVRALAAQVAEAAVAARTAEAQSRAAEAVASETQEIAAGHQNSHQGGKDTLIYASASDLADVAAAAAAGDNSDVKIPRAGHVHAHGTGYLPNAHHDRSHDHSNASDGTTIQPVLWKLDALEELTISSGDIALTGNNHTIDTEGDASNDQLEGISGDVANGIYRLSAANTARTVWFASSGSVIVTGDGRAVALDDDSKQLWCWSKAGQLTEIARNFPLAETLRIPVIGPEASDEVPFRFPRAKRLVSAVGVINGGTSVDNVDILTATNRSDAGTSLLSSSTQDITSTTTGTTLTLATDPNIAADAWNWVTWAGVTGTVVDVTFVLTFIDGNYTA